MDEPDEPTTAPDLDEPDRRSLAHRTGSRPPADHDTAPPHRATTPRDPLLDPAHGPWFDQHVTRPFDLVAFDRLAPPPELTSLTGAEVLERWTAVDRGPQGPVLVVVRGQEDGPWGAAALVTARPGTAYLKIVDVVGDQVAGAAAVLAHAARLGRVLVKWEGWTVGADVAAAAGFTPLGAPTLAAPAGPATGYARWLDDPAVAEPAYYQQTATFSCGAVAALVAAEEPGTGRPSSIDRPTELGFWRTATNFPSCEPVGLGVAVRRRWPDREVAVAVDTDAAVMLEHFTPAERDWRAVLQRSAREDAAAIGVPVRPNALDPSDVRAALRRGGRVLLLLQLTRMLGYDVPHWVLCHAEVPGAIVLQDSWINAATGETWVDPHLLPVADDELRPMSGVFHGPDRPPFHAAVVVAR